MLGLGTVPLGRLKDFQQSFGFSTLLTFHSDLRTVPWGRWEAPATLPSCVVPSMSDETREVGRIGA